MYFEFFETTLWETAFLVMCFISFGESRAFRVAILIWEQKGAMIFVAEPHCEATLIGNYPGSTAKPNSDWRNKQSLTGFSPPTQSNHSRTWIQFDSNFINLTLIRVFLMSAPFQFYCLSLVKDSVIQVSKNTWSRWKLLTIARTPKWYWFVGFTLEPQV